MRVADVDLLGDEDDDGVFDIAISPASPAYFSSSLPTPIHTYASDMIVVGTTEDGDIEAIVTVPVLP